MRSTLLYRGARGTMKCQCASSPHLPTHFFGVIEGGNSRLLC
jgi:hypothetical protein